jgi:PAS domain S-box-containing protein
MSGAGVYNLKNLRKRKIGNVKRHTLSTRSERLQGPLTDLEPSEFYLREGERLAHMGSWSLRPDGIFDYWSPETFAIFGFDPAQGIPTLKQWLDALHPTDGDRVHELIRKMFSEGVKGDIQYRAEHPEHGQKTMHSTGDPMLENGVVTRLIGNTLDITEQEKLTQELRRREAYLAEAQRLSHTGSFGWDVSTGEIFWSDETFRIFELDPKTEITIELIIQRTHPDDRQAAQQVIERASREKMKFALEHRLLMPDGSIKFVHVVGHPSTDEGRRSEFVGAVIDITDQRRAEESLRQSESYLAEAQKLSHTGSWAWNPEKDIRYWSDECYRVLGFDPRGGLPRVEELFQRIHPDDQVAFQEDTRRAIREKVDVETEYRIVHPSGAVRNIRSTGHSVLSASGDLIELVGTVIDVTERKIAEEKIREQEAELRQILDLTPNHLYVFGPDGGLLYVNEFALAYLGADLAEMAGSRINFIHPDDRPEYLAEKEKGMLAGKPYEFELRILRRDDISLVSGPRKPT